MYKIKRMLLCLLLAVVGQIIFTSCHTAYGFGEDLESAGQSLQKDAGVSQ